MTGKASGGKIKEGNDSAQCFIHSGKVNDFLLKPGAKHSREFFDSGYTESDGEQLVKDITEQFDMDKAVEWREGYNGSEQFVIYMWLRENKKRFKTVWQIDRPGDIPRIISAYRKDK